MTKTALLLALCLTACANRVVTEGTPTPASRIPCRSTASCTIEVTVVADPNDAKKCIITAVEPIDVYGKRLVVWSSKNWLSYQFTANGIDPKAGAPIAGEFTILGTGLSGATFSWQSVNGGAGPDVPYTINMEGRINGRSCPLDPVIINRGG